MRVIIVAAVLGVGSAFAVAGPSDHTNHRPGDNSSPGRTEARKEVRVRTGPYALAGDRVQRRVVQFRDVPRGRGQTERAPFWRWVSQ